MPEAAAEAPPSATREPGRASATIQTLLDTAERLFAEKGVEHVSLRQIVLASGHRNVAAMQYHFGSRAELVTQVLRRRREFIDAARNAALDACLAGNPDPDVPALVQVTTRALADTVRDQPWGPDYLSVLAQATLSPQLREDAAPLTAVSGMQRVHALLRARLQHVQAQTLEQRLTWLTHTIVYALAQWCRSHDVHDRRAFDAYVANLIDFCSGAMAQSGTGALGG
ncbi:TetR/AcrR family transcriptional regulator [Verticiella sediminum]|nr:TetR/AcrR family transcriptional regulator [Verticiella sediminum]